MINVLWAALVLFGIGILCALLLAFTDKYFGVKADERVSSIRGYLPGANCGACGYTGCDGYAEAVARGEALANLCIPGGKDAAMKIADLIGGEAGEIAEMKAFVHCGGAAEVSESETEFVGPMTCHAKNLFSGGDKACKSACLGCGDCAEACPVDAITVKGGLAWVNPAVCIGCGKCVSECPKAIISLIPKNSRVAVACSSHEKGAVVRKYCKVGCIGCKKCENTCKWGAIKVVDNLATVDYGKCVGCGECVGVCPTGCITYTNLCRECGNG